MSTNVAAAERCVEFRASIAEKGDDKPRNEAAAEQSAANMFDERSKL